jgi:hypothetical protein
MSGEGHLDKEYLLQKMGRKGDWAYTEIPEILQSKRRLFGRLVSFL